MVTLLVSETRCLCIVIQADNLKNDKEINFKQYAHGRLDALPEYT